MTTHRALTGAPVGTVASAERVKIAILDDYQNVALQMADWSAVSARADITVFNDHLE